MILKGSQRGHGGQLAAHLLSAHENDHFEVHQLRGFLANDLAGRLRSSRQLRLAPKRGSHILACRSIRLPRVAPNSPTKIFARQHFGLNSPMVYKANRAPSFFTKRTGGVTRTLCGPESTL